jgi:hypothetical protein
VDKRNTQHTLFSAYVNRRRHAALLATASIFIGVVLVLTNANLFVGSTQFVSEYDQWAELITWAGCPAGLLAVGESEMPW